jgi:peptide chain release factor subunit 1
MRFARLRLEKRHNYVVKIAELSNSLFLSNDRINVTGLILAGSADFKTVLSQNDVFDARLQVKILSIVDIAYGGENGFNQAIELAGPVLGNVKFIAEKKILTDYFERIATDSGTYCFGIEDTLKGLEMGAVEVLLCYEDLATWRIVLNHPQSGADIVKILTDEQLEDDSHFKDLEAGVDLEVKVKETLVEWLCAHYKDFGARLTFVTNKSTEGSQFCRGFGGIGGILRYKVDFLELADYQSDGEDGFEGADEYEDCFI